MNHRALPSKPLAEVLPLREATRPMGTVRQDLCHTRRKDYLIMVDHYPGYPFVQKQTSLYASAISISSVIRTEERLQYQCPAILGLRGSCFRPPAYTICDQTGWQSSRRKTARGCSSSACRVESSSSLPCWSSGTARRGDGFSLSRLMLGCMMKTALSTAWEALAYLPLTYVDAARKETHDEALSWMGSCCLDEVF